MIALLLLNVSAATVIAIRPPKRTCNINCTKDIRSWIHLSVENLLHNVVEMKEGLWP